MEIELYKVGEGFGFRVGGVVQDYAPDCEGFVPMTREQAEAYANEVLQRLTVTLS